jgi:hypothetical protein
MEPWALREVWLCYAISIIYDGLIAAAADGEPYGDRAREWREAAEAAFSRASSRMDYDEDGTPDASGREGLSRAGVWLC